MKEKVVMCWSGGKDSALALYHLLTDGQYDVVALLTTMTEGHDRISMHGVRRALLERQAHELNLPLSKVYISKGANNQEYEDRMRATLESFKQRGIFKVAFGDIFLEDLKAYRDANLARLGMSGIYPIWKRESRELIRYFIDHGFGAVLSCIDSRVLPATFAGRTIDDALLRDLPPTVDPCGENGEFHSFVFRGPLFKNEIEWTLGEEHRSDPFVFRDIVPLPQSNFALDKEIVHA